MWFVTIIAFLLLNFFLAEKCQKKITEIFPAGTALWIFLLYLLAFFRRLSAIDGLSLLFCLGVLFFFGKTERGDRQIWIGKLRRQFMDPVMVTLLLTIITVSILVMGRTTLWWDDLNFWATDVKSIYYLEGFAGKYGNVAPAFGDYPPGIQLFKWWFLHFSPAGFKEGLMFSGYYSLILLLLAPLFSGLSEVIKTKAGGIVYPLAGVCMFLFPAVAETFYLEGSCADLPMALAYGCFLWLQTAEKQKKTIDYVEEGLLLGFLILCKNMGFLWVGFALFFKAFYEFGIKKKRGKALIYPLFITAGIPCVTGGSWFVFCLLKRRVAKLTGAGLQMAVTGNIPIPSYARELVDSFIDGLIYLPIHRKQTIAADLTVMGVLLILAVVIFLFRKGSILGKKEGSTLSLFLLITGLLTYGMILAAHLTVFAGETQYLKGESMVASIERYGAPFTLGTLYLLWGVLMKRRLSLQSYLFAMLFVFACTSYSEAYHALWGYRESRQADRLYRESMVDEQAEIFLEKTDDLWKPEGTRILYLRDGENPHWVRDTYISFEGAPVGVVYADLFPGQMDFLQIQQMIKDSHAAYLYADWQEKSAEDLFEAFTDGFTYQRVYRIELRQEQIRLLPVE